MFELKLMVDSLSGRNRIAESFRELARDVVQKNGLSANVDEILFLVDEEASREARTASDIGTVGAMLHDVIFQLTLRRFQFYVKFIARNIETVSPNVFSALLYHELRHIKKSTKTGLLYLDKHHDIEDWEEMVSYGDWERVKPVELPNFFELPPAPSGLSPLWEGGLETARGQRVLASLSEGGGERSETEGGGFSGGESVRTDCRVGLSGSGGGVLALPVGEGAEAAPLGYREPEALSGLHCEGGEGR